jgi:hypothetical protein
LVARHNSRTQGIRFSILQAHAQTVLETQQLVITKYGVYHDHTLSTPLLMRIIIDLLAHGQFFFAHHTVRTYFDLELHLRCLVAGLRLLCAHGMEGKTGTISFPVFDDLYKKMSWWQSFHLAQIELDKKRNHHDKVKNYNNEFLIVYIRDLISSIPSDQSIASNISKRFMAATAAMGHAVKFINKSSDNSILRILRRRCHLS